MLIEPSLDDPRTALCVIDRANPRTRQFSKRARSTRRSNNYSELGISLGRQFRALKLWFVLRAYGLERLRNMIRNHIAWSCALCEKLRAT